MWFQAIAINFKGRGPQVGKGNGQRRLFVLVGGGGVRDKKKGLGERL